MDKLKCRDALLDFFFPQVTCLLCGSSERVQQGFCAACVSRMERCREDKVLPEAVYTDCTSCYIYEGRVRDALRQMKFHGAFDLPVRFFGSEMAETVRRRGWQCDLVVPVPAEPTAMRRKGYNQAEKLAARICRLLHLPMHPAVLRKRRGTRSQVGLTRQQRLENMAGAILPGKGTCAGKSVLLVDDLITTGATVCACCEVLLQMGARAVYVVSAARPLYEAGDKEKILD